MKVLSSDRVSIDSEFGPVVRQVIELEALKQAGLTITMADISPLEARGLVILYEERQRIQRNESSAHEMSERGAEMRAASKGF